MSLQDRIARLEALLSRVRSRRSDGHAGASTPLAAAPKPSFESSNPPASAPPPVAARPLPTPIVAAPPEVEVEPAPELTFESSAPSQVPVSDSVPVGVGAASTATLEIVETPPLEALNEEDLVEIEMSSDVLESVPPPPVAERGADLDFEDEEEQAAPLSSGRHRVATMDEVLSAAEREPVALDHGREVPIHTPPPESGPQEAVLPMGLAAPPAPDVDALFDSDVPPISMAVRPGPTPEQLGQTVDLEEAGGPRIELDAPRAPTPPPPSSGELEMSLPERAAAAGYEEDLLPPPEAQADLNAHRERTAEVLPAPEVLSAPKPSQAPLEMTTLPAPGFARARAPSEPELFERAPVSGVSPIAVTPAVERKPRPTTFVALLDASIELGG